MAISVLLLTWLWISVCYSRRPEIWRQNGRQDRSADERRRVSGWDGDEKQQSPGKPRFESGPPVIGQPIGEHRGWAGVPGCRHCQLVDRLSSGRRHKWTRVAGASRFAATDPVAPELNSTRRPTQLLMPLWYSHTQKGRTRGVCWDETRWDFESLRYFNHVFIFTAIPLTIEKYRVLRHWPLNRHRHITMTAEYLTAVVYVVTDYPPTNNNDTYWISLPTSVIGYMRLTTKITWSPIRTYTNNLGCCQMWSNCHRFRLMSMFLLPA